MKDDFFWKGTKMINDLPTTNFVGLILDVNQLIDTKVKYLPSPVFSTKHKTHKRRFRFGSIVNTLLL